MANTIGPPPTGTGWDESYPDVDDAHGNACYEIRDLRVGLRIRLAKEHVTPATSSAGGEHIPGGCQVLEYDTYANLAALAGMVEHGIGFASDTKQLVRFDATPAAQVIDIDHGSLSGLADNDHPQYIEKDGTTADISADIPMNSHKITGLADGTASGDALHAGQVDGAAIELNASHQLTIKDEGVLLDHLAAEVETFIATSIDNDKRDYIKVVAEYASGTDGGDFTSGDWRTRPLTTEEEDTGDHCSLSANRITLAAGTYECDIAVVGHFCGVHQARLYNISDSAVELLGTTTSTYYSDATFSLIKGRFTIADSKIFEIQHRCASTRATDGMGLGADFGTNEVFVVAQFWKIN